MLNTQNILRAAALLGSCALAAAQQPCIVTPSQVHTVPLSDTPGSEITKLRAGVVLTPGVNELLALQGTNLVMVSDAMSAPRQVVVAADVVDFAVLPAVNGLSRVAVVGPEGLRISKERNDDTAAGATLGFETVQGGDWKYVTHVDAAASGDVAHIVGAVGPLALRGKLESGEFRELAPLEAGGEILKLALADAHSIAGLEIAIHTPNGIGFYLEASAFPYLSVPASSGSAIGVDRIPRGAGVRDSFGVWMRTLATDYFVEIVDAQISAQIFGGPWLVHDVSYGAVGITFQPQISTLETDMIVVAQNNDLVALHGLAQTPAGLPFYLDATQFSVHSLPTLLSGVSLNNLRVACADFDGDGDGDIAIASSTSSAITISFVRNDCSYAAAHALVAPFTSSVQQIPPDSTPGMEFMGASTGLEVRQPPIFNGVYPTHVRARVFIREYYNASVPQAPVSPDVWWDSTLLGDLPVLPNVAWAGSTAQHSAVLDFEDVQLPMSYVTSTLQLTVDNVVAYFEFVPLIKDSNGAVVQRANATVWVGAVEGSSGLVHRLICVDEPDEFSALYPCGSGGEDGTGQLITDMHRRRIIRPIPPTTVPQ